MDLDSVLSLFDSYWFNVQILKKPSNPTPSSSSEKIQENSQEVEKESSKLEMIQVGFDQSDDLSYYSDCYSPNSVLQQTPFLTEPRKVKGKRRENRRRTKTRSDEKCLRKSLSELEYEELKGFMDLGFEFSENDVNSNLVEMIPGLQKLCKNRRNNDDHEKVRNLEKISKSRRSRPYLSEAWEVLENKKKINSLSNWKVPYMSNEIDIKQSLKLWAHTVASSVNA